MGVVGLEGVKLRAQGQEECRRQGKGDGLAHYTLPDACLFALPGSNTHLTLCASFELKILVLIHLILNLFSFPFFPFSFSRSQFASTLDEFLFILTSCLFQYFTMLRRLFNVTPKLRKSYLHFLV